MLLTIFVIYCVLKRTVTVIEEHATSKEKGPFCEFLPDAISDSFLYGKPFYYTDVNINASVTFDMPFFKDNHL